MPDRALKRALPAALAAALLCFAGIALLLRGSDREAHRGDGAAVANRPTSTEADVPPPQNVAPVAGEIPKRETVAAADPPPAASEGAAETTRPTALVYGSLLDPSGEPIQGAWSAGVSFVDENGRRRAADAKDEGAYAIPTLPIGTYSVTAWAHGYRPAEETVEVPPDQPVQRRDFTLRPSPILKIKLVTPEGRNLFEALRPETRFAVAQRLIPVATLEPPGERLFAVAGSANNRFGVGNYWNYGPLVESLPPGFAGVLVLTCDLPVHVSLVFQHVVLDTRRVEPGTDEVVFVVSPETLEGKLATILLRVVDAASGEPIEGARILEVGTAIVARSDVAGAARIENQPPGRYQIEVRAEEYETALTTVVAEPGAVTDLGEIRLDREIRLEGRFLDGAGNGVAVRFGLSVLDPAGGSIDDRPALEGRSDASGSFAVQGLGRRTYVLRTKNLDAAFADAGAGTPWVSGNVLVDLRSGPPPPLEVRLVRATRLALRVEGDSAEGLRFRVVDEGGYSVVAGTFYGGSPRPLNLPAGLYRVSLLDAAGALLAERSVTLGPETVHLALGR